MSGMTFTFGSGVADSVFGKSQAPIRMFLESRGEAFEQASPLKKLFAMDTDKSWGVKMTGMTAMNGFSPVGENGAYPADETQEGYDKVLTHEVWKDSFSISREAVDDGKLTDFKKKPQAFIKGYHRTREQFGAALYAGAISGKEEIAFRGKQFGLLGADGKTLFAADHPSKLGKASQSNLFSDAFSAKALGKLETRMQNFKGDNDEILDVAPTTILIPNDADAKEAVFAAIGADKDPATSNNAFNYQFGRWNVICWTYLNQFLDAADNFPWVLLDEAFNEAYGGAAWFDRVQLDVRSEISANDANVWKGYARWSAGFNDWRFAALGGIAGGDAL